MSILGTFTKQPGDTLDYDIDFTDWLGAATIFSQVTTAPAGLTITQSGIMAGAKAVKFVVSGGTHGTKYKVQVTITTDTGLTKEAEVNISVKDV